MGFWEVERGEVSSGNWFKERPKITLIILTGVIAIIVIISI